VSKCGDRHLRFPLIKPGMNLALPALATGVVERLNQAKGISSIRV
jgi:hypothetical protein